MKFSSRIFNPFYWFLFLRSKKDRVSVKRKEMVSFAEQLLYRINQVECAECYALGKCKHCGCKSPHLFIDPLNECSAGYWNKMVSPEEWEEHKKQVGFKIGIKIN